MQLTVSVPEAIIREARLRDFSLIDFVEALIDKGMRAAQGRPDLERAMAQFKTIHAQGAAKTPVGRMGEQAAD